MKSNSKYCVNKSVKCAQFTNLYNLQKMHKYVINTVKNMKSAKITNSQILEMWKLQWNETLVP